jgi:hypothetical protein
MPPITWNVSPSGKRRVDPAVKFSGVRKSFRIAVL